MFAGFSVLFFLLLGLNKGENGSTDVITNHTSDHVTQFLVDEVSTVAVIQEPTVPHADGDAEQPITGEEKLTQKEDTPAERTSTEVPEDMASSSNSKELTQINGTAINDTLVDRHSLVDQLEENELTGITDRTKVITADSEESTGNHVTTTSLPLKEEDTTTWQQGGGEQFQHQQHHVTTSTSGSDNLHSRDNVAASDYEIVTEKLNDMHIYDEDGYWQYDDDDDDEGDTLNGDTYTLDYNDTAEEDMYGSWEFPAYKPSHSNDNIEKNDDTPTYHVKKPVVWQDIADLDHNSELKSRMPPEGFDSDIMLPFKSAEGVRVTRVGQRVQVHLPVHMNDKDANLSVFVLYTWLGLVALIVLGTFIMVKYKQRFHNLMAQRRRPQRVEDEDHNLLLHQHV